MPYFHLFVEWPSSNDICDLAAKVTPLLEKFREGIVLEKGTIPAIRVLTCGALDTGWDVPAEDPDYSI